MAKDDVASMADVANYDPQMHGEQENIFDANAEELRALFNGDNAKIQSLINALDKHGANLSINKFARITATMSGAPASSQRYALAQLAHWYTRHPQKFQAHMSKSKLDEKILAAIKIFFEKLSDNGKQGLNILYEATGFLAGWPGLAAIDGGEVQIKEIKDEKDNILGYVPFARVELSVSTDDPNGDDLKISKQTVFLTLDQILQVIEGLKNMYQYSYSEAKRYQKNIANTVLIPEGDDES